MGVGSGLAAGAVVAVGSEARSLAGVDVKAGSSGRRASSFSTSNSWAVGVYVGMGGRVGVGEGSGSGTSVGPRDGVSVVQADRTATAEINAETAMVPMDLSADWSRWNFMAT